MCYTTNNSERGVHTIYTCHLVEVFYANVLSVHLALEKQVESYELPKSIKDNEWIASVSLGSVAHKFLNAPKK